MIKTAFCILVFFFGANYALAEDQVDLEGAHVFGNHDLPNITYVIPWKDEKLDIVETQPVTDFFDNSLKPLDRDVFLREMGHLERLRTQQEKKQ